MRVMQGVRFAFGPFVLDPGAGTLLRDDVPVAAGHRGLQLLAALVARPGEILAKAELMDAAWPGTAVEEGNLTVQIAQLRKLLGPAANGGEWISTVPRVGYRFTGAIEQLAANPWGPAVMWAGLVGCAGLALWQLSEATLRARRLPPGQRLGKLISSGFLAVAYGSVGLTFAGFAVGMRGDSGDSTKDFSIALVQSPLGIPALIGLGLTVIGVGIYFIVKGVRKKFKEELHHFEGSRRGHLISALGVAGHVAKGIALILAGLLFVVAAAKNQPGESTGLDGSLKALLGHPAGPYLLMAIAAGLISYGMFALVRARFGRM